MSPTCLTLCAAELASLPHAVSGGDHEDRAEEDVSGIVQVSFGLRIDVLSSRVGSVLVPERRRSRTARQPGPLVSRVGC